MSFFEGGAVCRPCATPLLGEVEGGKKRRAWAGRRYHEVLLFTGHGGRGTGTFRGYGRFLTGVTGKYYFRTIRPVRHLERTPHIHLKVHVKGRETLTTQ